MKSPATLRQIIDAKSGHLPAGALKAIERELELEMAIIMNWSRRISKLGGSCRSDRVKVGVLSGGCLL